jgi:hypothetical protein
MMAYGMEVAYFLQFHIIDSAVLKVSVTLAVNPVREPSRHSRLGLAILAVNFLSDNHRTFIDIILRSLGGSSSPSTPGAC